LIKTDRKKKLTETIRLEDIDCSIAVKKATAILESGGLVVYPTDTSYGLACDPRQSNALERLFEAKQRDRRFGVPLLFSDESQCESFHLFTELERVLTRLFWPGMLTLIVEANESVPDHITGGRSSIAIRVPDHIVPRSIAKELGGPIVGTSANLSGGLSPFDVSMSKEQLGDKIDLYIDGGPSRIQKNSTIIGVEKSGSIKVYREGAISVEGLTEQLRIDSDTEGLWTIRITQADL
jgi:L-threonylcarbamoyladenylate synthase